MLAISLGVLIIGAAIGAIPLIVAIIKKKLMIGIIIVVLCGVSAMFTIFASIAIAVIGLLVLLLMKK